MAGKIKVLSSDVINKIAAGEIVERPSSVVKELLENALDAGATQIVVELKNGGKKLIRVTDNGSGMSSEDAHLALKRHSTSKIATAEDLANITSYGFRGEALPSIGAVSRLVLTTKLTDEINGTVIEVEGGAVKKSKDSGCAGGTTLMVRDLFFNTPARLKFIKSNTTETGHVSTIVTEQALANSGVSFKLISNERELMHVPTVKSSHDSALLERIGLIFGKDIVENLISVKFENKFLKLSGFISIPAFNRVNKNQQLIFVNRRSIKSRVITHAIYEGYHGFLTSGRHPIIFLFIDIDPTLIDVNVHPSKREVRFTNEQGVHELINRLVRETLTSGKIIPEVKKPIDTKQVEAYKKEDKITHIQEAIGAYLSKVDAESQKRLKIEQENVDLFERTKFVFSPSKQEEEISLIDVVPLVQVDNLYIIAKDSRGFLIIDQHAASERVLYEKFRQDYENSEIKFQDLLFPITIELPPQQSEMISENLGNLRKLGFTIENFGVNTFIVKTVPVLLGEYSDKQVILDIFDVLAETTKDSPDIADAAKGLSEQMLKIMACHAAIRAGDALNREEIYSLIEDLQEVSIPYTCPHGRPSMIRISFDELDKRFKRK